MHLREIDFEFNSIYWIQKNRQINECQKIQLPLWFKMEFTGHRNLQGRDFDYHFLHGFGMPEHQFLKS